MTHNKAKAGRFGSQGGVAIWVVLLALVLSSCSDPGSGTPEQPPDVTSTDRTSGLPSQTATPGRPDSSSKAPSRTTSAVPDKAPKPRAAVIREVPKRQWDAMVKAEMVRKGCPINKRSQLRRVEVDYINFDGKLSRGYLVVNADTAQTTVRIFTRLKEAKFPIRRMQGLERYGGDTLKSLQDDNTSAYNCRRLDQINAPPLESPHANGRAIDINPRENPWKDLRCDCWSPSPKHAKRSPGKGKIVRGDVTWQTFTNEGWIWQNIDVPDYMHFDTGYPSTGYSKPPA